MAGVQATCHPRLGYHLSHLYRKEGLLDTTLAEVRVIFFDIGDTLARAHFAAGRLASLEPLLDLV